VKPNALVVMDRRAYRAHFDAARLARLGRTLTLGNPEWVTELDSPAALARLQDAEVLVTSWGAPTLTEERLACAPRLRAVFHCAGTVRWLLGPPAWARGIRVSSAADANAIPVAEFTLAAVIFAGKQALFTGTTRPRHEPNLSNFRRTVGIVGFSRIGRRVVELLGCLDSPERLVADPYADPLDVAAAGATLSDLYDVLPRSEILSLHAPALPSTRHMIGAGELALLPDHATLINTARGSLVDTAALTAECRTGRISAILDVTDPEPLPADHELRHLPNVTITPHLAGSTGTEVLRLTDYALAELDRWLAGEPLLGEVTPEAYSLRA
jgi:phosphoglycerate dehydrogenase-like enzyme